VIGLALHLTVGGGREAFEIRQLTDVFPCNLHKYLSCKPHGRSVRSMIQSRLDRQLQ
jgi:hypothetical protein